MPKWCWRVIVAALVGTFIHAFVQNGLPRSGEDLLMLLVGLAVFGGSVGWVFWYSKSCQNYQRTQAAHVRSAFSALAERTGLRLETQGFFFPRVMGAYRNHDVYFTVNSDEDGIHGIFLNVSARYGVRWPKDQPLSWGKPPAWLSPTGRDVLRQLWVEHRAGSHTAVASVHISSNAISCLAEHTLDVVATEPVPGLDPPGTRRQKVRAVADPVDLHAILDDLILLAESLSSVPEP